MNPITQSFLTQAGNIPNYGQEGLINDILTIAKNRKLFTRKEAAEYFGVSVDCIKGWQRKGTLVPSIRSGRRYVRFTLEDINNCLRQKGGTEQTDTASPVSH